MCLRDSKRLVVVFFLMLFFFTRPSYATGGFSTQSMVIGAAGILGAVGIALASGLSPRSANSNGDNTVKDKADGGGGGGLEDDSVVFNAPGMQYIELFNNSTELAVLDSIVLSDSLGGVGIGDLSESCKVIAPQGTCQIPLVAAQNAYGSGRAVITYNGDESLIVSVTVAKTALMLYEETTPQNDDVLVATNKGLAVTRTFKYVNVGAFSWQNPSVSWQSSSNDSSRETVTVNNAGDGSCNGDAILPNASCTFSLTFNYDEAGDLGVLRTIGANIDPYLKAVIAT